MKLTLVGIGGVPATGKSRIVSEIVRREGLNRIFKYGTLVFHTRDKRDLYVLGKYEEGEAFPGTDRLSMAVIKDALGYVHRLLFTSAEIPARMIFEGDRLFCNRFLDEAEADEKYFLILATATHILSKRREERKQSEVFLKGRATKIRNMMTRPDVVVMDHNEPKDTEFIIKYVMGR